MKKVLALILVLICAMVFFGCVPPKPEDPIKDNGKILNELPDLIDYSTSKKYYDVARVDYSATAKSKAIADLQKKQKAEKDKKDEWDDDTTTFTKIFCYSDVEQIVSRMAKAGLPEARMVKLVDYITREDTKTPGYGLVRGTTGAIQDYEELDKLYDLYEKDAEDENGGDKTVYENMQLKRRKVFAELEYIFETDGDQCARVVMEQLSYAQDVVEKLMIPEYNAENVTSYDFDEYFKIVLFDYEGLVYFKAFNQTVDFDKINYEARDKKEIVKLYGYYYQYEYKEYKCFTDKEYERYLELGQKDYFDSDAEALEYTKFDRKHYAEAYRYTASFYKLYYTAHFKFQEKQENFDKEVYGIDHAIPNLRTATYSGEMLRGLNVGMESTLILGDINYQYTGVDANVKSYNQKNKAWKSLSDRQQDERINLLKKVNLQVEQLKSQYNTMTHNLVVKNSNQDLIKALQYQIRAYSGDYIRGIQANKKNDVIYNAELERLDKTAADYEQKKKDKEEEIGRNKAMLENLLANYGVADIEGQITKAGQANWNEIKTEINNTIKVDYKAYHEQPIDGKRRYEHKTKSVHQVDKYFEEILIKRIYKKDGIVWDGEGQPDDVDSWEKEYDTDHSLSRLLNNHETVFRHMSSQIEVTYKHPKSAKDLEEYVIDDIKPSFLAGKNYNVDKYDGSGILSMDASKKPIYYANKVKETVDKDKSPALVKWNVKIPSGKYLDSTDGYVDNCRTIEKKENGVDYIYYFEFMGWYVDKELKYIAKADETYKYDIALYAGFYITKVIKTN